MKVSAIVATYNCERYEDFLALAENFNDIRLRVDTWQDMDNCDTIEPKMSRPHWEYNLEDMSQI